MESKDAISSYESRIKKGYSEFGKEGLGTKNWGTLIFPNGERINGYTDERFIYDSFTKHIQQFLKGKDNPATIADFGGNDGFLLNKIFTQLKEKNPDLEIKGLVVDANPTNEKENFQKEESEGKRENMEFMAADITHLPIQDAALDTAISRMTMQYLSQDQQEEFLKEVSRVLKNNGLFLLQTITDDTENESFNDVIDRISDLISPEFRRSFPNFSKFLINSSIEEKYRLKMVGGSKLILFPFSVSAWADRFDLDKTKIEELEKLYQECSKEAPELFDIIDGHLCLKARLLDMRFIKTPTS